MQCVCMYACVCLCSVCVVVVCVCGICVFVLSAWVKRGCFWKLSDTGQINIAFLPISEDSPADPIQLMVLTVDPPFAFDKSTSRPRMD